MKTRAMWGKIYPWTLKHPGHKKEIGPGVSVQVSLTKVRARGALLLGIFRPLLYQVLRIWDVPLGGSRYGSRDGVIFR